MKKMILRVAVAFAAATSPLCVNAARAETILLTCGTYNIAIDLTNNTANNFPAKISAAAIDWQVEKSYPSGQTAIAYWHVDRIAGTATHHFTLSGTAGQPVTSQVETERCTRSTRPKF